MYGASTIEQTAFSVVIYKREGGRSSHVSEGNISFVCVGNGQDPLSHSWRARGEYRIDERGSIICKGLNSSSKGRKKKVRFDRLV